MKKRSIAERNIGMFKSLKRIVYPVVDLQKAKEWYSRILGVQPLFDAPTAVIFQVGECSLSLAKSDAPPDASKAVETFWEVGDIETCFQQLVDAGAQVRTPIKNVLNTSIAQVVDPFGNVIGITGLPPGYQRKSVEYHPSETAHNVAFCRALAAKEERAEIRGADHLAELFVNDEAQKALKDSASRKSSIQNVISSALYGYFIARTAYFDEIFRQALAEQIPQIVFLGAGYDTRVLRFRESLGQTRVFELDVSST
ncbi:MAG: hypothetical protein EHM72_18585 [Calditrichaeota bacterium]|nr:MAG: hypothetical protein EHM72_18585 [Calditrichota bacterium]